MLEFKKVNFIYIIAVLYTFIFLGVCKGSDVLLANKSYNFISINDVNIIKEGNNDIFISFDKANNFNGYSGCNFFKGIYEEKEGSVVFKNIVTTRKICFEDRIQKQEYLILKLLQDIDIFSQNKDETRLGIKGKKDVIILRIKK